MGEAGGLSPQPCRAHLPVGVWCRQVGEHLPSPLHATGCLTWAQKPRPGARLPPDGQQEASAAALMVGGQAPLHPALIDLGAVPRCPVTHSSRAIRALNFFIWNSIVSFPLQQETGHAQEDFRGSLAWAGAPDLQ